MKMQGGVYTSAEHAWPYSTYVEAAILGYRFEHKNTIRVNVGWIEEKFTF
jgi:hypothetical protein